MAHSAYHRPRRLQAGGRTCNRYFPAFIKYVTIRGVRRRFPMRTLRPPSFWVTVDRSIDIRDAIYDVRTTSGYFSQGRKDASVSVPMR